MGKVKRTKRIAAVVMVVAVLCMQLLAVSVPAAQVGNPDRTKSRTVWDCIYFGNYNGSPIKWRVLNVNGNDAFLMADGTIGKQTFKTTGSDDINWKDSTLRTWLNTDFMSEAFNDQERAALIKTTVVNSGTGYKGWCNDDGGDTEDYIYLPSYADISNKNYGFIDRHFWYVKDTIYWLRSLGANPGTGFVATVQNVIEDGEQTALLGNGYRSEEEEVRPVLHMNISAAVWTYAGTVSCDTNGNISTGSGSSLPNTDSSDPRTCVLLILCISVLGAGTAWVLKKQ